MLQQTQVITVIDYFNRFMTRFPNVAALAKASESDVLKMWEGLGYYRRARQLHATARIIADQYRGRFPDNFKQVLALPGIGRYTASAILSIADDQPLPVLEGNTMRVYSRLLDFSGDVTGKPGQEQLWCFAEDLVTKHRPGDLNQALMELGSEICHVRSPQCTACPVQRHCLAFQQGDPESLPNKGNNRTRYESLRQAAVVIRRRDQVVVRLCGPGEHWAGLWDFPRVPVSDQAAGRSVTNGIKQQTGLTVQIDQPFMSTRHAVTRFRIQLDCFHAIRFSGRLRQSSAVRWIPVKQLGDLPMSTTGRKIADQLI